VPPELDEVVRKALARAPSQRFASARDMARALEQACPQLFNEEQLGTWVSELFPETKSVLRSLLSAAQKEAPDTGELTTQVKKLRRADADSAVESPLPPAPAAVAPTRTVPPPGARPTGSLGKRLTQFALAGCAVVVLSGVVWAGLLALGVSKLASMDAAPTAPALEPGTLRPGDELLGDGARSRQVEQDLRRGDFDHAFGLLGLCVKEGERCTETRMLLDEVRRLQTTRCTGGKSALEVLRTTWTQLRRRHFDDARQALEACRYERAANLRLQALSQRLGAEAQFDALLTRAELVAGKPSPTLAEVKQAQADVKAAADTVVFGDRVQVLNGALPPLLKAAEADTAGAPAP